MTRVLIVCYSLSGTTRKLAGALADRFGADLVEVRCKRYGPGIISYLRAGYDSLSRKLPPIDAPPIAAQDYDLVLLGTPVWTSYAATPMRAFLSASPDLPARIGLFLTQGGQSPPEKTVADLTPLLPGPIEAVLALKNTQVEKGEFAAAIDTFIGDLGLPLSA